MNIKEIADRLCIELIEKGFHILRYDAYSTESVYLKLDYGICNSIRISNHKGKKHLKYRFNLMTEENGVQYTKDRGFDREFYGIDSINKMIYDISITREAKYEKLYAYRKIMEMNRNEHIADKNGFWSQAKQVKLDKNHRLFYEDI